MGTCQNVCKQQVNEKEFQTYQNVRGKQKLDSDKDQKTDLRLSQQLDPKEDSIADEFLTLSQQEQPQFIKKKEIYSIVLHSDRKNRFLNDMEEEVKHRIKEIQQEEKDNLSRMQKLYEQELEKKKTEQKKKEQQDDFDNQFSFQNSMKQSQQDGHQNQTSNPYLPKQTSQFAPKRNDNDTVSQKSQISKTPTPPLRDQSASPKQDMMRKTALKKIQQTREELASMNASFGSSKSLASKKQQQLEAYEKLFSEYFSQDESGSHKTQKSVKSILKHNRSMSQRSISMGKMSIKSTHTVFKNKSTKKVRFSNDTNFNNERRGVVRIRRSWWDW